MRAETQNIVAEIEKSLNLLGQRMDIDTAQHRLEELNARVEDPKLWDDPAAAQKLMRDRQMLVDAMETYESIRTELKDNVELGVLSSSVAKRVQQTEFDDFRRMRVQVEGGGAWQLLAVKGAGHAHQVAEFRFHVQL